MSLQLKSPGENVDPVEKTLLLSIFTLLSSLWTKDVYTRVRIHWVHKAIIKDCYINPC